LSIVLSSAARGRLRGHNADTNFPTSDYAEELAAVDNGQVGDRNGGFCQRRRSKASRFRGVCLSAGKYVSQITVDNKHHYLGVYATEVEAAKAYDRQGPSPLPAVPSSS
jgi:allantoicase